MGAKFGNLVNRIKIVMHCYIYNVGTATACQAMARSFCPTWYSSNVFGTPQLSFSDASFLCRSA